MSKRAVFRVFLICLVCFTLPIAAHADSITIVVSPPGAPPEIVSYTPVDGVQRISPTQLLFTEQCVQTSDVIIGFIPGGSAVDCFGSAPLASGTGTVNILEPGTIDPSTNEGLILGVLNFADTIDTSTQCLTEVLGVCVDQQYRQVFTEDDVFSLADGPPQYGTGVVDSASDGLGITFQVETVPEPSGLTLLATGLACLGILLYRKRNSVVVAKPVIHSRRDGFHIDPVIRLIA